MSEIDEIQRRITLKNQLIVITQEEITELELRLIELLSEQEG